MFKEERLRAIRILALLIALVSLAASAAGVIRPQAAYRPVLAAADLPFVVAQDVVSLVASLLLLALALFGPRRNAKADVLQAGLAGYLFYAYAQYVLGLLYGPLYFLYLAAFGLSIFYFIVALSSIDPERSGLALPEPLRISLAAYCAAMPLIFVPQWVVGVIGCIQARARPSDFGIYWVYVLDLCFVMPACALAAILLLRKKPFGTLLSGVLAVKGFTLLSSVALGNYFGPLFGQPMLLGGLGGAYVFTAISLVFLALSIWYFLGVKAARRTA